MTMIDNHCHVFLADGITSPAPVPGAAYGAPPVGLAEHRAHLDALGCDRGVLVQPSAYGTSDHGVLLATLRRDPDRLRGVACVPVGTPDADLREMHRAGVRATRVQDGYPGGVPVTRIAEVAAMVQPFGWHIEVWSDVRRHVDWLAPVVRDLPVPVVIDHLGHLPSDVPTGDPAVAMVTDLLADGHAWVTLSGLDRLLPDTIDPEGADFADRWQEHEDRIADRVATFVAARPDQVMWGTDWPHVGLDLPHPSAQDLLHRLHRWVPDGPLRTAITTDNAARRYGFDR